jgi:LAO/AO transport system kinase
LNLGDSAHDEVAASSEHGSAGRLVPFAGRGDPAERPRPKQPDVLITTASTGEGVPALLAALDRHRAAGREGLADGARLSRAEAQVWAIVSERLRARFHGEAAAPATEATLRAVADHRLDPYTAADRLLASLGAE